MLLNMVMLWVVGETSGAPTGVTGPLPTGTSQATSQLPLTGTVKNSQEVPLEGVSVYIKDTDVGTATDAEGRFVFEEIDRSEERRVGKEGRDGGARCGRRGNAE